MADLKEIYKEHRIIVLPQYTKLTEYLVRQFDCVLEATSPAELRDHLLEVYHRFIITEHECLPADFQKIANNLYILLDFLTLADKEMNKREEE